MISKYYYDYYRGKIRDKEINEIEGLKKGQLSKILKKLGLKTYMTYFKDIDTGDVKLNEMLRDKYASIVNRCNGMGTDKYGHYNGTEYMTIQEYVEFCNNNKDTLIEMWEQYMISGKSRKYAISIDRIDNNKGYVKGNMQFILNGFNSWKRGITPIKVTHDGVTKYFMSSEEGSRHYGLRKQTINECLRKTPFHLKGYETELSTIGEVLSFAKLNSIEEYYYKYIM